MRINHNIGALNTYSRLSAANTAQGKSLEKLSSGQRINRAGDDAAGLAISEKMRSQIRGLDQASRNSQDGISMIQTAEGALNETQSILQRMRELSVQAANDTNTSQDRGEIQKEINQLSSEINRIAGTTEFNKQTLLNGGLSQNNLAGATTGVDTAAANNVQQVFEIELTACISGNFGCDNLLAIGDTCIGFATPGCTGCATASFGITCTTLTGQADQLAGLINADAAGSWTATSIGNKVIVTAVKGGGSDGGCGTTCATISWGVDGCTTTCVGGAAKTDTTTGTDAVKQVNEITLTCAAIVEGATIELGEHTVALWDSTSGTYENEAAAKLALNADEVFDISKSETDTVSELALCIADSTGSVNGATVTTDGCAEVATITVTADTAGVIGMDDANVRVSAASGTASSANNGTTLQIGANAGQTFTASFGNMTGDGIDVTSTVAGSAINTSDGKTAYFTSTANVELNGSTTEFSLDVSTADKASAAISAIDDSLAAVSAERSKLGSYQNRLEHTINNLGTASENLTAAESRIRDVDMAKEMMEFTKNNILNQAATSMLAQANQQPQGVLQLLG